MGLSGEFLAAFGGESSQPESLDKLVRRLEREEFDLIVVGRALLNDPSWIKKVRSGDTENLKSFSPAAMLELA